LHEKRKSRCKECGGSEICEHQRQKSKCKECGGSQICEHQRRKSLCKECGGSQICEHQRQKSKCKECGGSQICEHQRQKSKCKECGGSEICKHQREKSKCKECGGSQICEHQRQKSKCKECGGSQICEHQRQKSKCKECGGSEICEHQKRKSLCKECGGKSLCKAAHCTTIASNKRYNGYCLRCCIFLCPDIEVSRNYKTKEKAVADYIMSKFSQYHWICDKRVTNGCSRRRPDLFLNLGEKVLMIEIDENKHVSYDCSCENKRLMELSQDVGFLPIIFLRFNPDAYRSGQVGITSCWTINNQGICVVKKTKEKEWMTRLECLKAQVDYWLENATEKTVEVIELFYDV
jgi:hypothetical protein